MYTRFIINPIRPTLDTTLTLIENIPKLPQPLPQSREEFLRVQDIYMQELEEYANVLRRRISTLEGADDKWLKMYTSLSVKQRTEVEEEYKDIEAEQQNLTKVIDMAKDRLSMVETRIQTTQKTIGQFSQSNSQYMMNEGSQKQSKNKIKLPDLPFLTFDGNMSEWPRFWSSFERAMSDQDLNDADKLTYLVGALKGKPAKLVSGYIIKEENYKPVVNVLKQAYGQPDNIAFHLRKKLKDIPPMKSDYELWDKIMAIEEILQQLESAGKNVDDDNTEITIEEKLTFGPLSKVYEAKEADPEWNVAKLRAFLRKMAINRDKVMQRLRSFRAMETKLTRPEKPKQYLKEPKQQATSAFTCPESRTIQTESKSGINKKMSQIPKKNEKNYSRKRCAFCNGEHYPSNCTVYTDINDRFQRIVQLSLCGRCLRKGHLPKDCKTNIKPCYYCKRSHHGALCKEKPLLKKDITMLATVPQEEIKHQSPIPELTATTQTMNKDKTQEVLLMCKEVELINTTNPELKRKVVVLLDSGSQHSYIEEKLAEELQLPIKVQKELLLTTFAEKNPRKIQTKTVLGDILIKGGGKKRVELETIDYLTHKLQMVSLPRWEVRNIYEMQKAIQFAQWKKPEVLLGMDYFYEFVKKSKRTPSGYHVIDTLIGPIVAGLGQQDYTENIKTSSQYSIIDVNEFWELETIGIQREEQAVGDTTAITLFEKNVRRDSEGRYEVSWPWKTDAPQLSNNYWLCLGRLKSVLNRLHLNPSLLEQYNRIFHEQEKMGIIEMVPRNYANSPSLAFFLPHQPVITPKKETTKLRIVFDASAKTKQGKSLNEELYRGPVILPDLVGILLRIRMYKYIITADVEKAFLQIGLQEEDRNVTQFLWVKDVNKPVTNENLKIYRFRRILFGVIASPFLLAAVIKYHLKQYPSILSDKIQENLYVDNVMVGTNDLKFATTIYEKAKNLFAKAYMNLREFATNEEIIKKTFKDEDCYSKLEISMLGLKWNTKDDVFIISTHPWPNGHLTKRTILKFIASHFDPLGFISPILLPFKIGCQELWKQKRNWDEPIPEVLMKDWKKLESQWQETKFIIPRLALNDNGALTLHVFVDASTKAYAAAVYGRIQGDNETKVALLCAKNRIMPIKKLTIPKAELVAAVIGTRLVKFVQSQLKLPEIKIYAWSDSRCTIAWINKVNLQKLPRFVENRVHEIQKQDIKFRYVSSTENPADVATKGTTIKELNESMLWWQGPSFLRLAEENWPTAEFEEYEETENNLVLKEVVMNTSEIEIPKTCGKFIEVERFSNWNYLIRVMRWVLLFLKKFKSKKLQVLSKIPEINFSLIEKQSLKIILTSQSVSPLHAAYQLAKIMLLKQAQLDIEPANIQKWKLKLDKDDLWRVYDRLSSLPTLINNPIFLPRNNKITELIIMHEHKKQGHAGVSQTLTNLRISFWIDKSRQTVRQVITKNCMQCKRWKSLPFKLPEMAPLPKERLIRARPFQHTAVDYAGPFLVKDSQGELKKKWICLFTCLCTRAVHLQSVAGLSTAEFLEAYDRFTARRGCPETILSDNGTQFLAAADYVKANWRNITAYAPWQGGVYERLIGLMKTSLKQAIGRKLLNEQEWETLIVKTEGLLNCRPICQLNDDTRDTLRPIDFLLPGTILEESEEKDAQEREEVYIPNTQEQVLKHFIGTEKCLERLWKIWYTGYLQNLRERSNQKLKQRHCCTPRTPQVGEIVLVELNETHPRGKWPMARIVSIPPGKDGKIRTAVVELSNGRIVKRAISQLYPLEIDNPFKKQAEKEVLGDPNIEKETSEEETESSNVIITKHKTKDKKNEKTEEKPEPPNDKRI